MKKLIQEALIQNRTKKTLKQSFQGIYLNRNNLLLNQIQIANLINT